MHISGKDANKHVMQFKKTGIKRHVLKIYVHYICILLLDEYWNIDNKIYNVQTDINSSNVNEEQSTYKASTNRG